MHCCHHGFVFRRSVLAASLAALLLVLPSAWAGPDESASQADKLLRSAERAMFSGDQTKADAQLGDASALLEKLEAEAPDHSKLASLKTKYAKIRRDLDRRMGRETKEKAEATSTAPSAPPTRTRASSTSRDHRLPLAQRALRSLTRDAEKLLPDIEDMFGVDPTTLAVPPTAADLQNRALQRIERVENTINKTKAQYGDVPGLDLDALATARAKVAEAKARLEQLDAAWSAREQTEAEGLASATASRDAEAAAAQADADRLQALNATVSPRMEGIYGQSVITASTRNVEVVHAALAKIEKAEEILAELGPDLARMAQTYGTEPMNINNAFFKRAGRGVPGDVGHKLSDLLGIPELLRRTRAATADDVARFVETTTTGWGDKISDALQARLQEAREMMGVAVLIDPESDAIREMAESMDQRIEGYAERMQAAIETATWPDHVDTFAGPGSTEELAQTAKEFFWSDRGWGGRTDRKIEILDVCVRGPWQVADRDVYGRVIRWRLPVLVAVTNEELRPRNVARVYELSIVGMEGAPDNAPKSPPWDGCWVGDNYMMRLDRF